MHSLTHCAPLPVPATPRPRPWYARALGHDMLQRAYVPGPQKAVGRIQKCGGGAAGHAYFRAI